MKNPRIKKDKNIKKLVTSTIGVYCIEHGIHDYTVYQLTKPEIQQAIKENKEEAIKTFKLHKPTIDKLENGVEFELVNYLEPKCSKLLCFNENCFSRS